MTPRRVYRSEIRSSSVSATYWQRRCCRWARAASHGRGAGIADCSNQAQGFWRLPRKAPLCKTISSRNRNDGNRTLTASLDGEIRDGRHQMRVRVYFEDTDSRQIVYHANFLRFMERGRTNYLRLLGTDQHALLQEARDDAPGFTFVVRSMTIDFLKPAVLDDVLDVVTLPQEVRGASVTLLQECRRSDDLLVTARVRVAFISGVSRWSICR